MKIAIIGLGSMGKRRIRLLRNNYNHITVYGVDVRKDRQAEVRSLHGIETYDSLDTLISHEEITAVMVCTSPITHQEIIRQAINYGLHVFTELNLLHNYYDELMRKAEACDVKLFMSSTMLYRKEVQHIQSLVASSDQNITYRYHVGQYLKDWHPWESYQDFFVAHQQTNGCRELMAIELPWLTSTFGQIQDFHVESGKITGLKIDYPDHFSILLKHESGIVGTLNINVISRVAKRSLEIIGENLQLEWEGSPTSLQVWDEELATMKHVSTYARYEKDDAYSKTIIEDAYLEEIREFLSYIEGEVATTRYSFAEDKSILQLIDRIEGVEK